jgi:hypothetical protein
MWPQPAETVTHRLTVCVNPLAAAPGALMTFERSRQQGQAGRVADLECAVDSLP